MPRIVDTVNAGLWHTRMVHCVEVERHHTCGRVHTIVDGELCTWKPATPVAKMFNNNAAKNVLDDAAHTLCLSVCLGMIGRVRGQIRTEQTVRVKRLR